MPDSVATINSFLSDFVEKFNKAEVEPTKSAIS
jgi:hypothetical protein